MWAHISSKFVWNGSDIVFNKSEYSHMHKNFFYRLNLLLFIFIRFYGNNCKIKVNKRGERTILFFRRKKWNVMCGKRKKKNETCNECLAKKKWKIRLISGFLFPSHTFYASQVLNSIWSKIFVFILFPSQVEMFLKINLFHMYHKWALFSRMKFKSEDEKRRKTINFNTA